MLKSESGSLAKGIETKKKGGRLVAAKDSIITFWKNLKIKQTAARLWHKLRGNSTQPPPSTTIIEKATLQSAISPMTPQEVRRAVESGEQEGEEIPIEEPSPFEKMKRAVKRKSSETKEAKLAQKKALTRAAQESEITAATEEAEGGLTSRERYKKSGYDLKTDEVSGEMIVTGKTIELSDSEKSELATLNVQIVSAKKEEEFSALNTEIEQKQTATTHEIETLTKQMAELQQRLNKQRYLSKQYQQSSVALQEKQMQTPPVLLSDLLTPREGEEQKSRIDLDAERQKISKEEETYARKLSDSAEKARRTPPQQSGPARRQ